jgi:hypothetical protein
MIAKRSLPPLVVIALAALLSACTQKDSADPVTQPVTGPNSFLQFPNPQKQDDGSLQTDSIAYAQAYYAAIDPLNQKATLAGWMNANGFGTGGTEVTVVFGDTRDLGYGRRMTFRRNVNGTIAAMVENYMAYTVADYTYNGVNLEAAVGRDQRWHVGTNGIEFSPAPNGQTFAKFFTFNPTTGERLLAASLDGRGQKAMPGICIACHGGRADPLTAAGGFPREGNTRARLQPFHVDSFGFVSTPGFTRADQEASLKTINQLVLCTYALSAPTAFPEDACRPVVSFDEFGNQWQSTAADMIKSWYGGDGMPSATFTDTYLPAGWAGQQALYDGVVAPYCRVCHILRGTANQGDLDFMSFSKFQGYADRIKAHVFDRGNMPLAKIINQRFWSSNAPELLANFLGSNGFNVRDASGAVLRPGRPIADPGPDRTVRVPITLSATNSLFAGTYSWSIASKAPGSAPTLDGASTSTSATPVFNTNVDGTYVLQLVAGNGGAASAPEQLTLTVNSGLSPAPSAIRFSDIRAILQSPALPCTSCHNDALSNGPLGTPPFEPTCCGTPPIYYTDYNRGGGFSAGTAGDGIYLASAADDDYWFYKALRGRLNFTDVAASPLLRKPTGHHHNGGHVFDFSNTTPCTAPCSGFATYGDFYRAQYNTFANWIMNGAPY